MNSQETKSILYLPSNLRFSNDLATRYEMLQPFRDLGIQTGLMLVTKPEDFEPSFPGELPPFEAKLSNLDPFLNLNSSVQPKIIVMYPNMPLQGENAHNFVTNFSFTQDRLANQIEHTSKLPTELQPLDNQHYSSWHLNPLITPDNLLWHSETDEHTRIFEKIISSIRSLAIYANSLGVTTAIETTYPREFIDTPNTESTRLDDNYYWSDLGTLWPLLFWRQEISALRPSGSRLAIDVCHSALANRTLRQISKLPPHLKTQVEDNFLVSSADTNPINFKKTLTSQILENTQPNDIWHLSDYRYLVNTPEKLLQPKPPLVQEGVALSKGHLPKNLLRKLAKKGLSLPIHLVLEINEPTGDYLNNPETTDSLAWLLTIINSLDIDT